MEVWCTWRRDRRGWWVTQLHESGSKGDVEIYLEDEQAAGFARAVLGEYAAQHHMHRMQQAIFRSLSHEAVAAMEAG